MGLIAWHATSVAARPCWTLWSSCLLWGTNVACSHARVTRSKRPLEALGGRPAVTRFLHPVPLIVTNESQVLNWKWYQRCILRQSPRSLRFNFDLFYLLKKSRPSSIKLDLKKFILLPVHIVPLSVYTVWCIFRTRQHMPRKRHIYCSVNDLVHTHHT